MPPLDLFVRPSSSADVATLVALLSAVHKELEPERGGAMWAESEARPSPFEPSLADDSNDVDVHQSVAGIDGVILGYATTRLRRLHSGALVGVVQELVVDPEARGVGLGVALLQDAIEWSRSRSAVGVESLALPGQRETKNFFEAVGMKARLLTVYTDLS